MTNPIASTSPLSSAITTALPAALSKSSALVKTANGEYTAASVAKDPTDAAKLGLTKEKDGNYGTAKSTQVTAAATTSTSLSNGVQAALTTLKLGGA